MERIRINPRPDWKAQVESLGFTHHTYDDFIFWDESTCYVFRAHEIEEIQRATNEIESLCMELVDFVIRKRCYHRLNIPESAWPLIEHSWRNDEHPVYGRFDLSYDGIHPPKLLEYNADTPLCLLEASLVQKQWLEQVGISGHQMNSIHERLVSIWGRLEGSKIHLTCRNNAPWLMYTMNYIGKTMNQAGYSYKHIFVQDVLWDGKKYIDQDHEEIEILFKLTPWEWMLDEVYDRLLKNKTRVIEPAWKMILSNKGMLVLLWELFPGHPNLLPAYFEPKNLVGDYVKKPLLGREGANITLNYGENTLSTDGNYGGGAYIYQQTHLLPNFDNYFPVIGSWLIGGESAGLIIREDNSPITRAISRLIPHYYL